MAMVQRIRDHLRFWLSSLPEDEREMFVTSLTRINLLRLRIGAWIGLLVTLVNLLLLHLQDGHPLAADLAGRRFWVALTNLAVMTMCALYLVVVRQPASRNEMRPWHRLAPPLAACIVLSLSAVATLLNRPIGLTLAPYLMASFAAAAFLVLTLPQSLLVFGVPWLALLATQQFAGLPGMDQTSFAINSGVASLFAIAFARLSLLATHANFSYRRTIARQTSELEKANTRLARLSFMDGLTGVANRRLLDQTLTRELRRAFRENKPLSAIMIDIDLFKNFNDTYGHQAGDDTLRDVAKVLSGALFREGDLLARYGGEEFAVLLPGVDRQGAVEVAERMRVAVQEMGIPNQGTPLGVVTVSLGVACAPPLANSENRDLLARADKSLYQAKQEGRNRTRAAPDKQKPAPL